MTLPLRTARASLVLRRVSLTVSAADDDDPIVRLVSAFLTRVPTWLSALHRDVPEETALWAVQWLITHNVPEEDSYYYETRLRFDYTPMDRAAKRGFLSVVQFLHEHSAHGCTEYAIRRAAHNDHGEVVYFLYQHRWELEDVALRYASCAERSQIDQLVRAARTGNLDDLMRVHDALRSTPPFPESQRSLFRVVATVLEDGRTNVAEWLYSHVPRTRACSQSDVDEAIDSGNIEAVRFVLRHPFPLDVAEVLKHAVSEDQLEIVQLLCKERPDSCTADTLHCAAWSGGLATMRFLCDHYGEMCTTDMMDVAASAGSLDIVRYLHEHRTEGCTVDAMDCAAGNGHLEVVQYLHEYGTEGCTTDAMDQAATNGHLEVVQFLHAHRTEGYPEAALSGALSNDHLEVVRFLCEVGSDHDALDHSVVTTCFREKRPDTLRYLHASGLVKLCPDDVVAAIAFQQLEMIEFVYDHCVPTNHDQRLALERAATEEAATRGLLSVVVWLDTKRLHGEAPTSNAIQYASRNGHLDVAEYLLTHGHGGPTRGMMGLAAYRGRLDLVRYLQEQRPDGCNHNAIGSAAEGGHFDIVRYLCDHRTCDHRLDHYVTVSLIKRSRFEQLVFLHERDLVDLQPDDLVRAIQSANPLEMLELLYDACVVPAPERRLWILQRAIEEAAKLRAKNVLVWIDSKRLDGEVVLASKAMEYAAKQGHLEIAEYLVTHGHAGCSGAVMNLAAFRGCLELVRYLYEVRGDGVNERALQLAERKGHADVVAYINEYRGHGVTSDERGPACRCRFCMEGHVVQNEPSSSWGCDGDY